MNRYYVITWYEGDEWHQEWVANGVDLIRSSDAHHDNPDHRGVQVWEAELILGRKEGEGNE